MASARSNRRNRGLRSLSSRGDSPKSRRPDRRGLPGQIDFLLEERTLLSTYSVFGDNDFPNENDVIRLQVDAANHAQLDVFINNNTAVPSQTVPFAGLDLISVQTFGGNDTLIVDSTNGAIPVPISYDGGTGANALTLQGGAASTDTYAPGPAAGAGTSTLVIGGVTQTVDFQNLAPVLDTVGGPLVVSGTSGSDAISYGPGRANPVNDGLVTVNSLESIEFTNKVSLTINTGTGTDTTSINNPNIPVGLTGGIAVNGGDPSAGDRLIVTAASPAPGFEPMVVEPSAQGAGRVVDFFSLAPNVSFTGMGGLTLVGNQSKGDPFGVDGTLGNDNLIYTQGATPDTGSVTGTLDQNNATGKGPFSLVPIDFVNMSQSNGIGIYGFAQTGGSDTLVYNGTSADDNILVTGNGAGSGTFNLTDTVGGQLLSSMFLGPVTNLTVDGQGGNNTVGVTAAAAPVAVVSANTLNFTGSGAGNVTVDLGLQTVTEAGFAPVSFVGTGVLNVDAAGKNLLISGTSGSDRQTYIPTSPKGGTLTEVGSPLVTSFSNVGRFTLSPLNGGIVTVDGTGGSDQITATSSATPTVQVNGFLPVTLDPANVSEVDISAGGGDDSLTVDSTAGAYPIPIHYDGGTGSNKLTLQGGTASSDTYAPGPGAGSGTSTIVIGGNTQRVGFTNLAPVFDSVAGPLTVNGTNGNNAITYTAGKIDPANDGLVTVDNFESIEFTGKTSLTINTGNGTDTTNIANPVIPAGMTGGITVNGGDPSAGDRLIDTAASNGPGFQQFSVEPKSQGAGSVLDFSNLSPTVNYTGMGALTIAGNPNKLTSFSVDGTAGNDLLVYTPGATADAGQFTGTMDRNNATGSGPFPLTPVTFSGISQAIGIGVFGIIQNGGNDAFVYNATGGADSISLTPGPGAGDINLVDTLSAQSFANLFVGPVSSLTVDGKGSATVAVTGNTAAVSVLDAKTLNFNGTGAGDVTLDLAARTLTEAGLSPVSFAGVATVNVNVAGKNLVVDGTLGADDVTYTPTGAQAGTLVLAGTSTVFNLSNVGGTFTLNTLGGGDTVTVVGTSGSDNITATGAAAPTVQVNTDLPVTLNSTNTQAVDILAGGGDDNLTVDSTTQGFAIPINYDGGTGSNQLTLRGGTALSDNYLPGPLPGAGTSLMSFGGTFQQVNFTNLAPVTDTVAGPLTVTGTMSNDTIVYTTSFLPSFGVVTVDNFESIGFTNKTTLNINASFGDDTVTLENPVIPTGLTGISVDGGFGTNHLVVDAFGNQPNVATPGTITIPGQVPITYTNFQAVQILNAPDQPLTPTPAVIQATEGQPLTNVVVGSFTDGSPTGKAGDFTASIDWGDGSPTTAGQVIANGNGGFDVIGSHTYTTPGSHSLIVTVFDNGSNGTVVVGGVPVSIQDAGGQTATITSLNNVTVAPATLLPVGQPSTGVEGTPLPIGTVVATFTDTGGPDPVANYSATITIGGTPVAAAVSLVPGSSNTFQVATAAAFTPQREGVFPVLVSVTDNTGVPTETALTTTTLTVADATPVVTPQPPLQVNEGTPLLQFPVATFTDPSTTDTPADFTATIDWGDGSAPSVGQISFAGGVYTVAGSHTYTEERVLPYPVTVTVKDVGGAQASTNLTATVRDAPLTNAAGVPVTATEGQPLQNVEVGTFTDANPFGTVSDFTATINWGDGSPASTGTVVMTGGGANGANFAVLGNHTYATAGTFPITITVNDVGGSTTTISTAAGNGASATVAQQPLSVTAFNITATEGIATPGSIPPAANTLVANFTDSGGADPLADYSATINWGDGTPTSTGIIVANGGGSFSVYAPTHTYAEEGTYTLAVTVTDVDPANPLAVPFTLTATAQATVADAALTPVNVGPLAATTEGTPLTGVTVATFTDANPKAPLSDFTASIDWGDGTPASVATITQAGGPGTAFSVTGDHTYAEERATPYSIKVSILDEGGKKAFASTSIVVNDAALTPSAGINLSAVEGKDTESVAVASFTDANRGATAGDFTATINWGDGSPVDTATVVLAGGSAAGANFKVLGSHVYLEEGSFPITVTITDAGGSTTTPRPLTATATVADAALQVQGASLSAKEGASIAVGTILATFTDSDPNGLATDFSGTIVWGDGSTTTFTSADVVSTGAGPNGQTFAIVTSPGLTHAYAEEGTYQLQVTVKDAGGSSAQASGTALVTDAALTATGSTIAATEGTPFSGTVANFTDADPNGTASDYTATITWGDGIVTPGVIVPDGLGGFNVLGTHTFEEGTYVAGVSIADQGGATTSAVSTFNVADAALTVAASAPVTATEGVPFSGAVGAFTDANPKATLSDFSATISWGDGSTSTGSVAQSAAGTFLVSGTHTYLEETSGAPDIVTFTVHDVGGSNLTNAAGSLVTVADAALLAEGAGFSAVEGAAIPTGTVLGSFTDTDLNGTVTDYSGTINWGDGTTSTLTAANIASTGASPDGQSFSIVSGGALVHTYLEEGSFQVKITVNDSGGSTANATGTATVADAALTVTANNLSGTEGTPIPGSTVVATFTDADPNGAVGDYSASINWGDGTTTSGTVAAAVGGGFTVSGGHTYAEEGTFSIIVSVADVGGASKSAIGSAVIADAALTAAPSPAVTATEGVPFTGAVGAFTDANPLANSSDFAATINWGDGTTSTGLVVQTASGSFVVNGTHTYLEETTGVPNAVTFTVKDAGGQTLTGATGSLVTVADAPLSLAIGAPVAGVEGLSTGTIAVATLTDVDPNGTTTDYTVTINWGDGTTSAGTLVANGSSPNGVTFTVNGSHTYSEEGTYAVGVAIKDVGGSQTTANTSAVIADAPLTAKGTPVSTVEGTPFAGQVASFTDADPNGTVSDYSATIDWGDGTPDTVGVITTNPNGPGFIVTGTHTYADSGVNGGSGSFIITTDITDVGGSKATAKSIATVQDRPLFLMGILNPASDSGLSHFDGITNINTPNFIGFTEPGATVYLFAQPTNGTRMLIGQGTADTGGFWSITTFRLFDGNYTVTAVANDRFGQTQAVAQLMPNAFEGQLEIDTVGPRVTNVFFDRVPGQIDVTFQDDHSGMDLTTVANGANYSLTKLRGGVPGQFLVNNIAFTPPANPTDPLPVVLTFNNGRQIRGGQYLLTINGTSSIRDVAGNALDGEFYGYFPSGNGHPGGNFVAQLDALHHRIFAPRTVIGVATPLSPPGQPATGVTNIPTANPQVTAFGVSHPRANSIQGLKASSFIHKASASRIRIPQRIVG